MNPTLTGGCLCGEIRYECHGEPAFAGNCHCRDCQRASGSAFTPAMLFPQSAVSITGSPSAYESTGDSGNQVTRLFCPRCGSQLFGKLQILPDMIGIRAGTLDDPAAFHPRLDFHVSSAAPWDVMDAALPKFPGAPTPS